MANPTPNPRFPPSTPCHAPPPLRLNGRVLVLTTSILVASPYPPPPPPAILTPLSHFFLFTFPLRHPRLGSLLLFILSPTYLLYAPLYFPFSYCNSSVCIVPSECMAGGQIFSPPPQPPATTPNQLPIMFSYLTSSPNTFSQSILYGVPESPLSGLPDYHFRFSTSLSLPPFN